MNCAWRELLTVLPSWIRPCVDKLRTDSLMEVRFRLNQFPEFVSGSGSTFLERSITADDLRFIINVASDYSPWSASTISKGFITAQGGHRIGICGETIMNGQVMTGIRSPTSLCIRVAKDFIGIARDASKIQGSILIIGSPGSGKTTFLRDLIRQRSMLSGEHIAVVDERKELFPISGNEYCFDSGTKTDILSGCRKREGIDAVLRCMSPQVIAMDEITEEEDCKSLISAAWCGVHILATAHARNFDELCSRKVYRPILETKLFSNIIVLHKNFTWTLERIVQ